ncbi:MAG: hypothetical protein OXG13_07650 [Gemmatimonadaceae bacterium]|nr:hypothetical protein [Gemmatimonadaceae bacterium]
MRLFRPWWAGLSLLALLLPAAAGRNVAVDAVTRATTWNEHEGDPAWLTDGLVPPEAGARPFVWKSKGILVFTWDGISEIEGVRIRVGEIANDYQVRTFVGGRLEDEGAARDPPGAQTARVEDFSRVVDSWVEIGMPPGARADNLELRALGPAHFFEVEILAAATTPVRGRSWAAVKLEASAAANHPPQRSQP